MDLIMKSDRVVLFEKTFEFLDMREEGMEAVVPDTLPDIARIVSADGAVIIREKEVAQERVSLAAGVAVNVLYVPEDGEGLRHLDLAMQFSLSREAPGVSMDSVPVASIRLTSIDARMLNPRKVVIRATLAVRVQCWDRGASEFYLPEGADADVRTRTESLTISPVVCVREKAFTVIDEYTLPASKPAVGQVLGHRTELIYEGVRAVGSKLVLKATARITFIYLTAEGGQVETVAFESAFSQLIELDSELTSPECAAQLLLSAEYVEPSSTGFTAELHVVAQLVCRDSRSVSYVSDCYSNRCLPEPETAETSVQCVCGRRDVRETLTGEIGTTLEVQRVCHCACLMGEPVAESGVLRLPVTAAVICVDENGQTFRASGSFSLEVPLESGEGVRAVVVGARCGEPLALPGKQRLELRVPVEAELLLISERTVTQLTAIHTQDAPERGEPLPSLTVVRAGEGDSLWSLGKKYASTVELIAGLNSLEMEDGLSGRILLIPTER